VTEIQESCSFCDNPADTKEHVIPQWLQTHFDLWNQRIRLWNGTSIPYRQVVIPACSSCNNIRFSRLENRVQQGQAGPQELYLWALKIRFGLAVRDSTLQLDRRTPEAGAVLDRETAAIGNVFIRHAFGAVDGRPFVFRPTPFGSVFRFRGVQDMAGGFGLVDVPPPYWALAVVLPRNEILAVLFADRGVTKQIVARHKSLLKQLAGLEPRMLMFNLLRLQNHLIIPEGLMLLKNRIISEPIPRKIPLRPQNRDWYREIALHCGLSSDIADEWYNLDQVNFRTGFVRRS
jgi:hypothetical protein